MVGLAQNPPLIMLNYGFGLYSPLLTSTPNLIQISKVSVLGGFSQDGWAGWLVGKPIQTPFELYISDVHAKFH